MSLGIVVAVVASDFDPQTPPPPGTPFKEKAKWHVKKKKRDLKVAREDARRSERRRDTERDAALPMTRRGC